MKAGAVVGQRLCGGGPSHVYVRPAAGSGVGGVRVAGLARGVQGNHGPQPGDGVSSERAGIWMGVK